MLHEVSDVFLQPCGLCIVKPTKEVEGEWGGVMCSAGTGGERMAKDARVAEELD
jgi:hypothetical protein